MLILIFRESPNLAAPVKHYHLCNYRIYSRILFLVSASPDSTENLNAFESHQSERQLEVQMMLGNRCHVKARFAAAP